MAKKPETTNIILKYRLCCLWRYNNDGTSGFPFFLMFEIILVQSILTDLFWGDEYTTRHSSRIRRVLCGSHHRSFVSLVVVPLNLAAILGIWFDPYTREIVSGESSPLVGIITYGLGIFLFNFVFYYLFILGEHSFKNGFYRIKVASIIEIYEKEHRLDRDVLADYIESMFLATERQNTTAEQLLQTLMERDDELGSETRAIVQELQAEYSRSEELRLA